MMVCWQCPCLTQQSQPLQVAGLNLHFRIVLKGPTQYFHNWPTAQPREDPLDTQWVDAPSRVLIPPQGPFKH